MKAPRKPLPSKPFAIRLNADERAALEQRAGEHALGTYVKGVLFGDRQSVRYRAGRSPSADSVLLARLLAGLGRSGIGVSLDRLAKAADIGSLEIDEATAAELKEACVAIAAMRLMLVQALALAPAPASKPEALTTTQVFNRAASGSERARR